MANIIGLNPPPSVGLMPGDGVTTNRETGQGNQANVDTEKISFAINELKARLPYYEKMRKYYKGKHPIIITSYEDGNNEFKKLFEEFADNLCQIPVDAVAERLELKGFAPENKAADVADAAWLAWNATKGNLQAQLIHKEALKAGDAYAIVWPDATKKPRIWPQRAPNVYCYHNPENPDEIAWAFKWWPELPYKRIRANLYFADRIEKYFVKVSNDSPELPDTGKKFEVFKTPGESWPLPNPFGRVPVFHFANGADIGESGVSEVEIAVPIQNALNKSVLDMLIGGEALALPQRYVIGLEPMEDPETGQPIKPFKPGAEKIWTIANDAAKFGQFDPADLDQFVKVQENLRVEFARITGLPAHYITQGTGQFPSGEALRTAEARLVKKCKDRQTAFGVIWGEVISFMLRLAGEAGETVLETQWMPAETVTPENQLNVATMKKGVGVSTEQNLKELGYSDDQISKMINDNADAAQNAMDKVVSAFNKGGGAGGIQ